MANASAFAPPTDPPHIIFQSLDHRILHHNLTDLLIPVEPPYHYKDPYLFLQLIGV